MDGYKFNKENLSFYSDEDDSILDEIDITIVHEDYVEEDKNTIGGTYIFLDNYLGELNSVTTIDNLKVRGKREVKKELIPIEKLKDFLLFMKTFQLVTIPQLTQTFPADGSSTHRLDSSFLSIRSLY